MTDFGSFLLDLKLSSSTNTIRLEQDNARANLDPVIVTTSIPRTFPARSGGRCRVKVTRKVSRHPTPPVLSNNVRISNHNQPKKPSARRAPQQTTIHESAIHEIDQNETQPTHKGRPGGIMVNHYQGSTMKTSNHLIAIKSRGQGISERFKLPRLDKCLTKPVRQKSVGEEEKNKLVSNAMSLISPHNSGSTLSE